MEADIERAVETSATVEETKSGGKALVMKKPLKKPGKGKEETRKCFCHKPGHLKKDCFKWKVQRAQANISKVELVLEWRRRIALSQQVGVRLRCVAAHGARSRELS